MDEESTSINSSLFVLAISVDQIAEAKNIDECKTTTICREEDADMEKKHIPFVFQGQENVIEAIYKINNDPVESGFDVLNVPFDYKFFVGHPTLHASVKHSSD